MTDIVIATENKNKIKEISALLKDMPVNVLSLYDGNWQIPEIVEDGETFRENAVKKAKIIAGTTGKLTLADDSGIEVDALGGKPGVISKRFAGENATDRENNLKLLQLLKDVSGDGRGAQFRCVIAVVSPDGREEVVEGICRGDIGLSEKGGHGFGYDPIFIPTDYSKTFAELSMQIKNKISHRGRALEKAKLVLEKFIMMSEARPRTS